MLGDKYYDCTYDGDDWHWGYEGVYGPRCWGEHYEACNGLKQSPIDIKALFSFITAKPEDQAAPLEMSGYSLVKFNKLSNTEENYGRYQEESNRVTNGLFKNNGHTAQLDAVTPLGPGQGVLRGGQLEGDYQILQLHFHWGRDDLRGSEHTLNGKRSGVYLDS